MARDRIDETAAARAPVVERQMGGPIATQAPAGRRVGLALRRGGDFPGDGGDAPAARWGA